MRGAYWRHPAIAYVAEFDAQLKRMDAARTEVDAGKSPGETALQSAANDVSSAMVMTTALGCVFQ
jgi:hypothetical protein